MRSSQFKIWYYSSLAWLLSHVLPDKKNLQLMLCLWSSTKSPTYTAYQVDERRCCNQRNRTCQTEQKAAEQMDTQRLIVMAKVRDPDKMIQIIIANSSASTVSGSSTDQPRPGPALTHLKS